MKSITVLTYDHPHRKTFDLVTMLVAHGYRPRLFALPWVVRKAHKPLIPHRPEVRYDVGPGDLSRTFGLEIGHGTITMLPADFADDAILIGGSGIIPDEVIADCPPIINSHPGYLPFTRGLDSVKWAILKGLPVGVTAHYVTPEVDAGPIIYQQMAPILAGDTFASIARRVYEMEVDALRIALDFDGELVHLGDREAYPVRRRMPHAKEAFLEARTQDMVRKAVCG